MLSANTRIAASLCALLASTFVCASGPLVRDRLFAYGIYEFRETAIGRGGDNHILTYRGYFGTRRSTGWGTREMGISNT